MNDIVVPNPIAVRRFLYENHGHQVQNVLRDEMVCSECLISDYKHAAFLLLVKQVMGLMVPASMFDDYIERAFEISASYGDVLDSEPGDEPRPNSPMRLGQDAEEIEAAIKKHRDAANKI